MVAYLAIELKGFVHFAYESSSCLSLAQPCAALTMAQWMPQKGEGVDNSIQLCLAPSRLWQMFLNSYRDQNVFTFRERIPYVKAWVVEKRGGRWL